MNKYVGLFCAFLMLSEFVFAAPKATREEHQVLQQKVIELEQKIDASQQQTASKQALITLKLELNIMREELQSLRSENERLRYEINIIQNQQREAFTAIDRKIMQLDNGSSISSQSAQDITGEGIVNNNQIDNNNAVISQQQDTPLQDTSGQRLQTQVPLQIDNLEGQQRGSVSEQSQMNQAHMGSDFNTENQMVAETVVTEEVDIKAALSAYRDAFILLKQNQHESAILAFQEFLVNYPATKYSANAQYWLGEANYVAKRYDIALQEFQKVIDVYPDSSKIPDARLKIGYTQYELEQWIEARATLGRLRAQLPDSKVAGLAQQRLERMDREGH